MYLKQTNKWNQTIAILDRMTYTVPRYNPRYGSIRSHKHTHEQGNNHNLRHTHILNNIFHKVRCSDDHTHNHSPRYDNIHNGEQTEKKIMTDTNTQSQSHKHTPNPFVFVNTIPPFTKVIYIYSYCIFNLSKLYVIYFIIFPVTQMHTHA